MLIEEVAPVHHGRGAHQPLHLLQVEVPVRGMVGDEDRAVRPEEGGLQVPGQVHLVAVLDERVVDDELEIFLQVIDDLDGR